MVKVGRGPAAGIVAAGTIHGAFAAGELALVNVLVTAHALAGSSLERKLARARLGNRWPVAIQTAQCMVRAGKREVRVGVIERL